MTATQQAGDPLNWENGVGIGDHRPKPGGPFGKFTLTGDDIPPNCPPNTGVKMFQYEQYPGVPPLAGTEDRNGWTIYRYQLSAGDTVHVGAIPVGLLADVVVETATDILKWRQGMDHIGDANDWSDKPVMTAAEQHYMPPHESEILRRLGAKMEQIDDTAPPELVDHPAHYQGDGIECIDAIEAMGCGDGFCRGSIVKYLWRLGRKDESLQELKKARWYLDRLIQNLEPKS